MENLGMNKILKIVDEEISSLESDINNYKNYKELKDNAEMLLNIGMIKEFIKTIQYNEAVDIIKKNPDLFFEDYCVSNIDKYSNELLNNNVSEERVNQIMNEINELKYIIDNKEEFLANIEKVTIDYENLVDYFRVNGKVLDEDAKDLLIQSYIYPEKDQDFSIVINDLMHNRIHYYDYLREIQFNNYLIYQLDSFNNQIGSIYGLTYSNNKSYIDTIEKKMEILKPLQGLFKKYGLNFPKRENGVDKSYLADVQEFLNQLYQQDLLNIIINDINNKNEIISKHLPNYYHEEYLPVLNTSGADMISQTFTLEEKDKWLKLFKLLYLVSQEEKNLDKKEKPTENIIFFFYDNPFEDKSRM